MRNFIVYRLLMFVRRISRTLYTRRAEWVGGKPVDAWDDYHLVAILNHTSLYEFLFASMVPARFLKRMARHGVVPIASKTIERPVIGKFWKWIAGNVVSISRERDHTWEKVMQSIDPNSMIIILPEGRMKRANGLDSKGNPMTVRGGIADILLEMSEGRMLLACSLGLHHIQVPGQTIPKLFQHVDMRFEQFDIAEYRERLMARCERKRDFRRAVIEDLTLRRDRYCVPPMGAEIVPVPLDGPPIPPVPSEAVADAVPAESPG